MTTQLLQIQIGEAILFDNLGRLLKDVEHVNGQIISMDLSVPPGSVREIKERLYKIMEILGQRFEDARKEKAA